MPVEIARAWCGIVVLCSLLQACASLELSPTPPAEPSPRMTVTVLLSDDMSDSRIDLKVIDESGALLSARSATAAELVADPNDPGPVWLVNPGGNLGDLRIVWKGSACDGNATLTLTSRLDMLVLDVGSRSACDLGIVGRGAVLSFSRAVPARSVSVLMEPVR